MRTIEIGKCYDNEIIWENNTSIREINTNTCPFLGGIFVGKKFNKELNLFNCIINLKAKK